MFYREKPLDEIYENFSFPPEGTLLSPEECMNLVCDAAFQGLGLVKSNPPVGALCVDQNHRFVAGAWHSKFGEAHAEQALIKKIHDHRLEHKLQGAFIYVSLEPCSHVGKTPSCAHLLGGLPIKAVIYGCDDITEKASGKGISHLKNNGVEVQKFNAGHALKEKLGLLLEHFEWVEKYKRPFVALKVASTLNGVFAHKDSSREWISCQRSRKYGHWLRLMHDSIWVGANTVIKDNPSLTVRHYKQRRTPLRVVFDPQGRALSFRAIKDQNLLKGEVSRTLWCLTQKAWDSLSFSLRSELESLGFISLVLRTSSYQEFTAEVYRELYKRQVASILVEGGASLWGQTVNDKITQKLYLFQAPKIFCRHDIMYWTKDIEINYLSFANSIVTSLQKDLLIEGYSNNFNRL